MAFVQPFYDPHIICMYAHGPVKLGTWKVEEEDVPMYLAQSRFFAL